jgi:hypothetical protein
VFLQKSVQAIENKGNEREKGRKGRKRGRKRVRTKDLPAKDPAGRR